MIQGRNQVTAPRQTPRGKYTWCAILALLVATLAFGTGCDEEAAGRAFRDAASGSFQSGLQSIVNGVIDGMFAAFELGADDTSSSSSSSTTE
jgi:hypothetical protein